MNGPVVKIEKDIPMPSGSHGSKYPWHLMEVGDSFIHTGRFGYEAARTGCQRYAPKVFKARVAPEGFRIWRVA